MCIHIKVNLNAREFQYDNSSIELKLRICKALIAKEDDVTKQMIREDALNLSILIIIA